MKTIKDANWQFRGGDVAAISFGRRHPLTFRKQAIYAGAHAYGDGEFEVDESLIDHWVETGKKMLSEGIKIPLPKAHTEDAEANRGWITGFEKRKDKQGRLSLYLKGKARDEETKKTLKANDISIYSPAEAKIAGKVWRRPILHAAITSYPVIKGLENFNLALSYSPEMAEPYPDPNMEYNPDCPQCQARKAEMEKDPPMVRRLVAFSEAEQEVDELHHRTGKRVLFRRVEGKALILAESEVTPDDLVTGASWIYPIA